MIKKRVSMLEITRHYINIYRVGYCKLQPIFNYLEPVYYNSGIYGWNCDIYIYNNIVITTGYRNLRGQRIPDAILKKYNKKASAIIEKYKFDYLKKTTALDKLRDKFFNELLENY